MESLYKIAYCDILLLPLGEYYVRPGTGRDVVPCVRPLQHVRCLLTHMLQVTFPPSKGSSSDHKAAQRKLNP